MLDKFIKYKLRKELAEQQSRERSLIREGLIMTHSLDYTVNHIKRFLGNLYSVIHNYNNNESIFVVYFKTKDKNVDTLLKFTNNMGYFVSSYVKDGDLFKPVGDLTDIDGLRFEAKYDMEAINLNRYIYHVTDKKNLDKILKIGLTPKTKSKLSYHPERIYLAKNENSVNDIIELFKRGNFINEPLVLKIDTNNLPNVFLVDKQFDGGVYTQQNIPPKNIEIVEE